jgi:hypothetical protein
VERSRRILRLDRYKKKDTEGGEKMEDTERGAEQEDATIRQV